MQGCQFINATLFYFYWFFLSPVSVSLFKLFKYRDFLYLMLMRTWNVIEVKPGPSSVRQQLNEEPQMDHLLVYSFFLEWFCYIRSYCVCSGPSAFRECSAHCVAFCSRAVCCFCFYCWESLDPPIQKNKQKPNKQINRLSDAIAIFLLEDSTKKENGSWPLYYFFLQKSLFIIAVCWQWQLDDRPLNLMASDRKIYMWWLWGRLCW